MLTRTRPRPSRHALTLIALALVALVLAGCGGDDDDDDAASPSVEGSETTATDAPDDDGDDTVAETTTTAADDDDTATTDTTVASPSGETPDGEGATDPWAQNTYTLDFDANDQIEFECPPDGTEARVWGTSVYTDDSSICNAAVHAGLITFEDGGTVLVELAPGQESYEGSEMNGVTSSAYASWGGSFVFPENQPGA